MVQRTIALQFLSKRRRLQIDNEFSGRGFESHHPPIINFYDFPHVELEKYCRRYPQGMEPRTWILTRLPLYLADLLSRCYMGGRVLYGLAWVGNWSTFSQWSNGLTPSNSSTITRTLSTVSHQHATSSYCACSRQLLLPLIQIMYEYIYGAECLNDSIVSTALSYERAFVNHWIITGKNLANQAPKQSRAHCFFPSGTAGRPVDREQH